MALVLKLWSSSYAQGARSSAGADGLLLLSPQVLNLFRPISLKVLQYRTSPSLRGRPPAQCYHSSGSEEGEAQGRGGWRPFDRLRVVSRVEPQAQAVGELTRRGREGGLRGSNLLTQAGRISPEEPHYLTESRSNLATDAVLCYSFASSGF